MEKWMEQLLEKADAWIDAHREEYIREIQILSRIPSVSRADLAEPGAPFGPECRRVLDCAMERGRHWGFDTCEHDGYAGSITYGDDEHALGVIAHLDVVPVGDGWVYPPFGANYLPEYDTLIGRGVDDNKGSAVAALFAMRMLKEFGVPLRHGIRLICGLSEETGMQDMKQLLQNGMEFPVVSLVPDASFPVNNGQKGSVNAEISCPCEGNLVAFDAGSVRNIIPDRAECTLCADIECVRAAMARLDAADTAMLTIEPCEDGVWIAASGRAGHAAFPKGCDNAIYRLARALSLSGLLEGSAKRAMEELADLTSDCFGRTMGVADSDEISGELTLVHSVANLRDGRLRVRVDCRSHITCDGARLEEMLRSDWTRRGFVIEHLHRSNPYYVPADDPCVKALQELYHDVTGRDDPPYTMGGGTYSRVVPRAISFGPGMRGAVRDLSFLPEGHGGAHGRDEAIAMDKVYTCSKIYVAALALLDGIVD